jgi:hypothetical protein
VLNFGISWWDAKVAGLIWREARTEGGWPCVVAWSAAVQSALGFTVVFAALLAWPASALHLLKGDALGATLSLTSLLVIVPLLGSGLVITIHSYAVACQERSPVPAAVAAWNTFAFAEDLANAGEGIVDAFSDLVNFVDGDADSDGVSLAAVIAAVALALGGGITLTYAILRSSMRERSTEAGVSV